MNNLRSLKYIRVGNKSLNCWKIIHVERYKPKFRSGHILEILYDEPDDYSGFSFFFATLLSNAPVTLRFRYNNESDRDEIYHFIHKIISSQLDIQAKLIKGGKE